MRLKEVSKKIVIPVIAGGLILGGLTGFAAARSSTSEPKNATKDEQQVEEQSPNYKGSIFLGQEDQNEDESKDEVSEEQENAALAGKAEIAKEEAAKAAYPDHTVKKVELEKENGYLVYEVEMTDSFGKTLEVKVDAGNAEVLATENESEGHED